MTDEMINLRAMAEKTILRNMIGFATKRLIGMEVGAMTGDRHGASVVLVIEACRPPLLPCRLAGAAAA